MSLDVLAKSGAIVSSVGTALLVAFMAILIVFPVAKECKESSKCSYASSAPAGLSVIIQPGFLAVSFMVLAAGVFMIRFSRWKSDKKTKGGF